MLVIALLATLIEITFSSNGEHGPFDPSTTDLARLLKSNYFVDKTGIIKSFFQYSSVIMVIAPHLFGKSTNLDIIKRFCTITVDETGNRVQRNLTDNYKLFTTNNLNIYKYDSVFFYNNFGVYPVIYLDFKQLTYSSYESFIGTFKQLIAETYFSHKYLLHSHNLDEEDQYEFKQYYYPKNRNKLEDYALFGSIETLMRFLYSHFNRTKCIVLIDDYDGLVQEAIFKSSTNLDQIIYFIGKFTSFTLKSNSYLQRALINACVRLGPDITNANNIMDIPFLTDENFYKFYGFTEEEVKLLLTKLNMSDMLTAVRQWYNGYNVRDSNITIYNPYSIVNYLASKKFDNYWVKSGGVKNLDKILLNKVIRDAFESILAYNYQNVKLLDRITVENINKLKEIINDVEHCSIGYDERDLFLQFMLHMGYFTVFQTTGSYNEMAIRIPNKEVKQEIEDSMHSVLYNKTQLHR